MKAHVRYVISVEEKGMRLVPNTATAIYPGQVDCRSIEQWLLMYPSTVHVLRQWKRERTVNEHNRRWTPAALLGRDELFYRGLAR